jgi:hypothetical protein
MSDDTLIKVMYYYTQGPPNNVVGALVHRESDHVASTGRRQVQILTPNPNGPHMFFTHMHTSLAILQMCVAVRVHV